MGALDRRTHGLSIGTVILTWMTLRGQNKRQNVKKFGNTYVVDRLRDRAEIL